MPDTQILSDEEVKAIEARANAATGGPWAAYHRVSPHGAYKQWHIGNEDGLCQITMNGHERDYEFMAHARTDIPALCHTVRAAWDDRTEDYRILSGAVREAEANRDSAITLLEQIRQRLTVKSALLDKAMAQALELDTQNATLRAQLATAEQERDRFATLAAENAHLNERLGIQEGHCKRLQGELGRAVREVK